MSLSSALEIGKSGLKVYQVATEVVSENIANVNTPGYSRQRVLLESAPPSTANGFPLGTGVKISTVERYYDVLLQKQLVNAGTTSGYDTKKSDVLQQIEPVFNEVAQDGLGAAISNFYSSWQDLTLNPTGSAERQAVLSSSQIMVDQFHYVSRTLNDAIASQNESLPSQVDTINSTLTNIAQLNSQIKLTEQVNGNANEMRDQRDYLVRQLAGSMAVNYTENSDGTTSISYTDASGTYSLVDSTLTPPAATLTTVANGTLPDGTTTKYDVQIAQAGGGGPTTIAPVTGELGATIVARDVTLKGYLDQVNTLANTMINGDGTSNGVNAQHQAGFDLNGAAGLAFFTFTAGSEASSIALNTNLTTDKIAASGSATVQGDNANALLMAQLQNTTYTTLSNASVSNGYNALVSKVGVDVKAASTTVSQDDAFMKQLTTLRDSNSGVSLDEELTDLIKYQRSYQASAKLISTAGDMMDTVINMIR